MKISKTLLFPLLILTIFWLQFWVGIASYISGLLCMLMILFSKKLRVIIFQNKYLLLFLLIIIISYLANIENFELISKNHEYKTGNHIPTLYINIAINGIVFIFCSFYFYTIGYKLASMPNKLIQYLMSIRCLFLINSLIAISTWMFTTGGVISRYNFESPIDGSPSSSATYALWGLILTLPMLKNSIFSKTISIVFILNILIVVTRLTQALFVFSIISYYCLANSSKFYKHNLNYYLKRIITFFIGITVFIILAYMFSGYYNNMFAEDSYDILSRESAIQTSLDLFLHNPIFGVGLGMFGAYNMNEFRGIILESPHNGFFSILCELGSVGLLWVLFYFFRLYKSICVKINIRDERLINIRYTLIIIVIMAIITFPFANFALVPPVNERFYYLQAFFIWSCIGILQNQYKLNKIK